MAVCNIKHTSDATRARCRHADCRARVARGSTTTDLSGSAPVPPRAQRVVPDANGNPLVVDVRNPVIRNCRVSPETLAQLPGVRLDRCTFADGDYSLTDATVSRCKAPTDARVHLDGSSQIIGSTMHGDVALFGETTSEGNAYHGAVHLSGSPTLREDYLANGYLPAEGSSPLIDYGSVTFGDSAEKPEVPEQEADSEARPASGTRKAPKQRRVRGQRLRRFAKSASLNLAQSVVGSLTGSRGRRY